MSAPKKRTVASLLSCAVNQDDKQRLAVLYKAIRFEKKAILEIERKQKRQQKQLEEEEEKVKKIERETPKRESVRTRSPKAKRKGGRGGGINDAWSVR